MGGTIMSQSSKPPIFQFGRLCKLLIFPIFQKERKVVEDCLESITYQSSKPIYIDRGNVEDCSIPRPGHGRKP